MKEEIKIFFTALMFYTRIPCPKTINHSPEYLNKSSRYFPLIGWIVGLFSFLVYTASTYLFGPALGTICSLIAGILTTGSFHEDGFADSFDGFGGGWTKERILDIMKDSRVGTYGVVALIGLFAVKYLALYQVINLTFFNNPYLLALLFINYHSLARLTAITVSFTSTYARADETSKSKPIAKENTIKEIIWSAFFGLLPLLVLAYFIREVLIVCIPLIILVLYSRNYFNRWLGGYTGDCLGAVEQIAECVILLSYVALWKFI